jgi:hypothetical protein
MDSAIDLSDPSKALDLANIRFQLMSALAPHPRRFAQIQSMMLISLPIVASKTRLPST